MPFTVAPATPADIPAICSIFLSSSSSDSDSEGPSSLMGLCLGSVDRNAVNMRQYGLIQENMQTEAAAAGVKYFVARDEASRKTAGFAQWLLPKEGEEGKGEGNEEEISEAEMAADRAAYRAALTPGMNVELCVRFKDEIERLRARILKARKHYLLMNLGTHPQWQRQGAASTLVKWPFDHADAHNILVYLDTAIDGPGRSLYEKLGFKRVGEIEIDMAEYGGQGVHTHIGMIRYPAGRERRESGVGLPDTDW